MAGVGPSVGQDRRVLDWTEGGGGTRQGAGLGAGLGVRHYSRVCPLPPQRGASVADRRPGLLLLLVQGRPLRQPPVLR